ncbi:hypothetical protein [Deinococcus altitudinis]|uniref:hypothetical protein n=1 Tax=Deinococcus altitudinis TaxID=468914 RepID=UPI003891E34F
MPRRDLELYPYRESYRCPLIVRRAHRRFLRDHLGLGAPVSSCLIEASTIDDALRVRSWPFGLPIDVGGLPAEVLAAVPGQIRPEELPGHTWRLFPRDPAVLWLPRVVLIRSGKTYQAELQFAGRQPLPSRPLGFTLQES